MDFIKKHKGILILLSVLFIAWVYVSPIGTYNNMVNYDETTQEQWGKVQSAYQERADLIPNLIKVTKGYAKHESETLENVIRARSEATKTVIDPSNMSPEQIKEYMNHQGEISSALSRLMVSIEKYPDLKANTQFSQLQTEMTGMENRIRIERNAYNKVVKDENNYIRKFPNNILSSVYGFNKKQYFEADEVAQTNQKVDQTTDILLEK